MRTYLAVRALSTPRPAPPPLLLLRLLLPSRRPLLSITIRTQHGSGGSEGSKQGACHRGGAEGRGEAHALRRAKRRGTPPRRVRSSHGTGAPPLPMPPYESERKDWPRAGGWHRGHRRARLRERVAIDA